MSNKRRDQFLIFFVLIAVAILSLGSYTVWSSTAEGPGFPLDDAWIHQTYARNLIQHTEWSFIPGIPSGGSTAPLWSAILAIGYADEKPEPPPKYRIETVTFIESWGQRKNIPFSQFGWWSVRWQKMGRDTGIAMKKAARKFKEKRKEKMMER